MMPRCFDIFNMPIENAVRWGKYLTCNFVRVKVSSRGFLCNIWIWSGLLGISFSRNTIRKTPQENNTRIRKTPQENNTRTMLFRICYNFIYLSIICLPVCASNIWYNIVLRFLSYLKSSLVWFISFIYI